MVRSRNTRGGNRSNAFKPSTLDIDDEPKFIELSDSEEEEIVVQKQSE